jgi:hypothetical protein
MLFRCEMPQHDAAAKLEQILTEADDLIRRRLEESGLEVMHVTLAITQDGIGVVRTNVGPEFSKVHGGSWCTLAVASNHPAQ